MSFETGRAFGRLATSCCHRGAEDDDRAPKRLSPRHLSNTAATFCFRPVDTPIDPHWKPLNHIEDYLIHSIEQEKFSDNVK